MSSFTSPDGPRTIVLPGSGAQTASYVLPPGLLQYVQSVLVEVDATAAGDVRPTLRVKEQTGVVIATKRPPEPIPSGDTGTATWALRLVDDSGGIRVITSNNGTITVTNPTGPITDLRTTPVQQPSALVRRGANQAIVTATPTQVIFDSISHNVGGMANLVTHPKTLDITQPGNYMATAQIAWDIGAGDVASRQAAIAAGLAFQAVQSVHNDAAHGCVMSVAVLIRAVLATSISLYAIQYSGVNVNLGAGTFLALTRLSDL